MFSVLLTIGGVSVHSYYIFWGLALFLLLIWTRSRACSIYGMKEADVSSVLIYVYFGGIFGSFIPGILERLPLYLSGKIPLEALFYGLYSGGGLLLGGFLGLWKLHKLKASADIFADAVSIPLMAMISVGRIGCLLDGCCSGIGQFFNSAPKFWIHFPYDRPNFWRFPSQPLETFVAAGIAILLLMINAVLPKDRRKQGGILFPITLISYGAYRLLSDPYRQLYADGLMKFNKYIWLTGIILGFLWFVHTVYRIHVEKGKNHETTQDNEKDSHIDMSIVRWALYKMDRFHNSKSAEVKVHITAEEMSNAYKKALEVTAKKYGVKEDSDGQ